MRKFLLQTSKFIAKHIWLYYLLNCTWGFLMTFIGLIVTLCILPFKRPHRYAASWCFLVGKWWGGISIGMTFIRDTMSTTQLNEHEYGHTFQNAIFGPLMLFVVTIPSAIRWWYRHIKYDRKGVIPPTEYDAIWFEASASEIGHNVH